MEERLREVVRHIGPSALAKNTTITNRRRWQTVATDRNTKARIEDLSALLAVYPEYEMYVIKGIIDPVNGQISPAYSEADLKLEAQNAGSN